MELQGTVKLVGKTESISDKFKKRELVITTKDNPQYPQHISLQTVQDKVSLFDNLEVGQEVNCYINLRGREWTSPKGETKYFNTIEVWKIELAEGVDTAPVNNLKADQGDLPF